MSNKMLLTTKLDQRLVMSQQLTQAITLLQYNTLDLKQLVQQYIETNPLIELEEIESTDTPEVSGSTSSLENEELSQLFKYSAEINRVHRYDNDESTLENYSTPKSLRDHLLEQTLLCKFDLKQQTIAESIIDAIDDCGYLTMSPAEIRSTLIDLGPPDLELIISIIKKIQTFDPAGIAALDLRECLLIQLNHSPNKDKTWEIAQACIEQFFDLLADNNSKKLATKLSVSAAQLNQALMLIKTLNPKPGLLYSTENHFNVEPELYVKKIKSVWKVFLSESILTNIKLNNQYHDLIKQNKSHESYAGLNKELQEAKWLLSGLKRRNETLLNVATHIMKLQKDFLDYGQSFMKPMNIIDVSQALNLHESTVSRVTTGKHIATPRGVFELKYFFPSYVLTDNGAACSDTAVKEMIKEIIDQESSGHIFSDSEIANLLKEKGINIARRTVAKYRDAMKILPSYQRAQLQGQSSSIEN